VALIPVGANESHGPHLPLGTDRICACSFFEEIAGRIDAVIAPEVPWGFRSQIKTGGGHHWVGSIGLDADLLVGVVRGTIRELAVKGMTRIAIVNGHYENVWLIGLTNGLSARFEKDNILINAIAQWGRNRLYCCLQRSIRILASCSE